MRRWARRIGIGLLVLVLALTAAAAVYEVSSAGESPARSLYGGPFVEVAGRSIAYRTWGTRGTPVILVGGFVEATDVWRRLGPLLARDHRVYALDLPPFGYSERKAPYTLDSWIDTVESFARTLGLRRPTLVGHSLGAAVVVGEARRHPSAVRGIVLLDGDALRAGGAPGWVTSIVVDPYWTALFRLVTRSDWIFRKALTSAYGTRVPRLGDEELDRWQRPFRVDGTTTAFKELLRYGIQGYTLADLRRVHGVRTVVAWGAQDTTDPVAAGRRSAAALRAPFVLLPNAAHLSMLADPAGVARAVRSASSP